MVRYREPIEAALVGEPPEPSQLIERPAEMTNVDAEPDAPRLIPYGSAGMSPVGGAASTTARRSRSLARPRRA
jgi:hypothetical protein